MTLPIFMNFPGRDEDAMQTIIQAFLDGAQQSMQDLKKAYLEKDVDEMGKLAHRMLPMLRQMKANEVIVILMKMESWDEVSKPEFNNFEKKFRELMTSLDTKITA